MTLVTSIVHAQKEYTTISKNINPEAKTLFHELSIEGDSLILKSESIFYKVTFLNSFDRKVYNFNPPVLESKISLKNIIVGDYSVLVYLKDRIVVFHITRLLEIYEPAEMIASKDISVNDKYSLVTTELKKIQIKDIIDIDRDIVAMNEAAKFASNDDQQTLEMSEVSQKTRAYDLTSVDRSNMQSRDLYRKNNLRPNGLPY